MEKIDKCAYGEIAWLKVLSRKQDEIIDWINTIEVRIKEHAELEELVKKYKTK